MSDSTVAEWLDEWNGRVVALVSNKGGSLKTSVATNLAGSLARQGLRVLLVALDVQEAEAAAVDLGYEDRADHGESLCRAMLDGGEPEVLTDIRPNLDVIADGIELGNLTPEFYQRVGRGEAALADTFSLLHDVLAPVSHNYDVILLDGPPGDQALINAALGVARWVIIPTPSDPASIRAMRGTARHFVEARTHNPSLELLGVVLTATPAAAHSIRSRALGSIREIFGGQAPTFESTIRYLKGSSDRTRTDGKLPFELAQLEPEERKGILASLTARRKQRGKAPTGPSSEPKRAAHSNSIELAQDYERLCTEVITRITTQESQS